MKKTALYVRTSTTDQDGATQLGALLEAATQRGYGNLERYTDIGHSGSKASRPALDLMRKDAQFGKVDVILIYGLDRLGRSLRDLLNLLEELSAAGAKVISLRESLDMTTTMGRAFVQFTGLLAEMERSLILDRVRDGVARAQASGKHCGRPLSKGAPAHEAVAAQRAMGLSWAQTAEALGCSVASARRAAKRL